MGGKIFTVGANALRTPRMTQEVYDLMKSKCLTSLKPLFKRAVVPIEAPEKTSYGDVDVLVSLESASLPRVGNESMDNTKLRIWASIEERLKASRTIRQNAYERHMALPFPVLTSSLLERQVALEASEAALAKDKIFEGLAEAKSEATNSVDRAVDKTTIEGDKLSDRFVQVDVRLCETDRELKWLSCRYAHGDFWSIIGFLVRPFGLVVDDEALKLCIPELEHVKKQARIPLTDDPDQVLEFLGLSEAKETFGRPFASVDAMFDVVARSEWFLLWPKWEQEKMKHKDHQEHDKTSPPQMQMDTVNQRLRERDHFARFVDEFLPRCYAEGRGLVSDPERSQEKVRLDVRRKAFEMFPSTQLAWNSRLINVRRESTRVFVKQEVIYKSVGIPKSIRRVLPEPDEGHDVESMEKLWRGVLREALCQIVAHPNRTKYQQEFPEIELPPNLWNSKDILVADRVADWITLNWEKVGHLAWRKYCIKRALKKATEPERLAGGEAASTADPQKGGASQPEGTRNGASVAA